MSQFQSIYSFCRILSLDVVLGACICTLFIANYVQVILPISVVTALGLGVWLIYTGDHLLDAYNTKTIASTPRHRFHQRYFKALSAIWIAILAVGIIPIVYLPFETLKWGVILSVGVVVYFLSLQWLGLKWGFFKEVVIAIIYSMGIFLGPMSLSSRSLAVDLWLLFVFFGLVALINLLLFSIFEEVEDTNDGHASIVQLVGQKGANRLILLAAMMACAVIVLLNSFYHLPIKISLTLIVMLLILLSINTFSSYYRHLERYRLVGDAIFYLPVICLWI